MQKFVSVALRVLYGCLFLPSIIFGQTSEIQGKLNQIEQLFAEWNIPGAPGVAVAITQHQQTIYTGGFGTANIEQGTPITANTVFDLASLAKPFTGMAIAMLVEQHKLKLTDNISYYLPRVPDFGVEITIDHLIHHTSGIRDWVAALTIAGRTECDVITSRHIWKFIEHQKELNFNPGDKFSYSNTNYFLLAEIIAKITDAPFSEWLKENILIPLAMNHTYIPDDYTSIIPDRACPYEMKDAGKYANIASNLASIGSSSMFSSVNDLTKWMLNFENPRVGGASVMTRMQQTTTLNNGQQVQYAYGLNVGTFYNFPTISHGGWWQGYRSKFIRFPTKGISMVVLTNCLSISPDDLATQMAMILFDIQKEAKKEPLVPAKIEVDPAIFDNFCGKYVSPGGETAFTVFKEKNTLFMQCTGFPLNTSIPVAPNKFYNLPEHEYILFEVAASGKANQLVVQYLDGSEAFFTKTDFMPITDQIDEICGIYFCPELQTEYNLQLKNKTLIAAHFHNADVVLSQELSNLFIGDKWWFQRVYFIWDKQHQVTGFRLDADNWRVNKLFFQKRQN